MTMDIKKFFKDYGLKTLSIILLVFVFCSAMIACPMFVIGIAFGIMIYPDLPRLRAWFEKYARKCGWRI